VSSDLLINNSGHDAESISVLWRYINVTVPLCVPGSLVLGGWPAPPYGHLGRNAVPASLLPVFLGLGISEINLNEFVDFVLWLRAGFVTPEMLGNGRLRPLSHAMCATLIMFYEESVKASEAEMVMKRMREGMVGHHLATGVIQANLVFVEWGKVVAAEFRANNLHLTTRADAEGVVQITAAVTSLAGAVAIGQHGTIARMKELQVSQDERMAALDQRVAHLTNLVSSMMSQRSPARSPSRPRRAADVAAADDSAAADGAAADGAADSAAADGAAADGATADGAIAGGATAGGAAADGAAAVAAAPR
jgi:hypothetical protein